MHVCARKSVCERYYVSKMFFNAEQIVIVFLIYEYEVYQICLFFLVLKARTTRSGIEARRLVNW